jgi:hypothetical protein
VTSVISSYWQILTKWGLKVDILQLPEVVMNCWVTKKAWTRFSSTDRPVLLTLIATDRHGTALGPSSNGTWVAVAVTDQSHDCPNLKSIPHSHIYIHTHTILKVKNSHFYIHMGTRGSEVSWGTILQVGKSRARFPMRLLHFLLVEPFQPHYGPGGCSVTDRNKYQEDRTFHNYRCENLKYTV